MPKPKRDSFDSAIIVFGCCVLAAMFVILYIAVKG